MNILSINNAGKREHGDNHWFWAVWIGIEQTPDVTPEAVQRFRPYSTWNNTEPTASGFCSTKKEANRAGWAAIKNHSPDWPRAYERRWARDMLWDRRVNDTRPYFSRCKAGKDKWLWVVHKEINYWDNDPVAHAYAASAEMAQEQAEAAVGSVQCLGNYAAEFFRSKEAAIKRSKRKVTSSGTATVEFVYECHQYDSDYDYLDHDSITPHRIVKRTQMRIYVEVEPYDDGRHVSGNWRDFVIDTFILDRAEFEATGKASRSGHWYGDYYADPAIYHAERRSTAHRPKCFVGLGVPAEATVKEIQAAYRRMAQQTHPDVGGDAKKFKEVHDWYEQAMILVGAA